jgi:hypothetical protein
MENFITGFPGHELQHRKSMLKVLGKDRYEFFFDKWLEYFFTDADAEFFVSLKLNCIRIPFNYRHFEDDMNPRVVKKVGFKHLDRVIDLVFLSPILLDRTKPTDDDTSARSTISTRSWTCTRRPAARIQIGIQTIRPAMLRFGTSKTTKPEPYGSGGRLRQGIKKIDGWLAIIL